MTIHNVLQRSDAWFALRCGRLTSSAAAAMLATVKGGGFAASRRNLCTRLALEQLTKKVEPTFQSLAMQQGTEREADALSMYEAQRHCPLVYTGFLAHDELMAGCSPDAIVGDLYGIVEAKCPQPATHLAYIRSGVIPTEYQHQNTHHLWISGAPWVDWISYNPDFPEAARLRVVRQERDEAAIAAYELMARQFLTEVSEAVADILSVC